MTQLNAFLLALIITIMDVAFILFGWNRSIPQVNKTIILVDGEIHKQLPAFFFLKRPGFHLACVEHFAVFSAVALLTVAPQWRSPARWS